MSLLILLVLGGCLLLAVLAVGASSRARGLVPASHEWMWVRAVSTAALIVGGIAAWLVHSSLDLGRGTMLAPGALGLFMVAGVALGETVVLPRRGVGPRTASLDSRRVADYLPRPLAIAVAIMAAIHLATLVLTTATASADDTGRAGRQVAARCGDVGSAAGPYPGSFYSSPLALLLLAVGLVTAAALVVVVRRPRGFAPDDQGDDVLRHRSTTRVLAAAGAALAASQTGIAFFAGTALLRMDCQRAWMPPVGWMLVTSMLASVLLLGWFLGRLVAPTAIPSPTQAARAR